MKHSIFNNRIPLSENTDIIFNSLSEQSIIIHKNATLPLTADTENEMIIKSLIDKGIICNDNEDEMIKATGIFLESAEDNSNFRLTINPTLQCNFRCWYCYEQHSTKSVMTDKTLQAVKSLIKEILNKHDSLELAFFGGEPFLEFDSIVLPLIDYTSKISHQKEKKYIVTFTTNGFLITPEIVKRLSSYNIGVSQITLDGGPLFHNKTRKAKGNNSFNRIVENIKILAKAGFPVLLRINLTKENAQSALDISNYFCDEDQYIRKKINVLVQQVWQDAKNDIFEETWDIYESFLNIGINPWPIAFNTLKAICYADRRHSAVVNYDGRIFKCTAIDFNSKQEDTAITQDVFKSLNMTFDRRIEKRMSNNLCKKCRIFPLCAGGCSKNIDQSTGLNEYCLHPTELDKDKVVKRVISEQLIMEKLGLR